MDEGAADVMEWWKAKLGDLDDDQKQAMQDAYYNTFYGDDEGRKVLLNLQRLCFENVSTPERTIARLEFLMHIKTSCGLDVESEMAAIEAEAKAIR